MEAALAHRGMGTCCVGSDICKKCREGLAIYKKKMGRGEKEEGHESGESSPATSDSYESVSVESPEMCRPPPPPPDPVGLGSSPSPARGAHAASPTRGRSPNRNGARAPRSPSPAGLIKGKGKGKGKGKPAAKCKFCWKRTGDYGSAIGQHYWSLNCLAWQYYMQGYPWGHAQELAAQTKARRVARFEAQTHGHTGSSSWREAPAEPTWRESPAAEPERREPVLRERREKKHKERKEPKRRKDRKESKKEPKEKKLLYFD